MTMKKIMIVSDKEFNILLNKLRIKHSYLFKNGKIRRRK